MRSHRRLRLVLLATAVISVANAGAQYLRGLRDPLDTDYGGAFSVAAHMLSNGQTNIYCTPCQHDVLAQLYHVAPVYFPIGYANPPLAAWLLQPLTHLPLAWGAGIFLSLSLLSTIIAVALGVRLHRAARAAAATGPLITVLALFALLPGGQTFALAQWDGFLLLAAVAAVTLFPTRPVLGGLVLSILCVKPQLAWIAPLALLGTRHWRAGMGFAIGLAVWVGSTLAIVGTTGAADWIHNVLPIQEQLVSITISVAGILSALGAPTLAVAVVTGLIAAGLLGLMASRPALRTTPVAEVVGVALLWTLAVTPHLLPHDLILAGLPLLLWARRDATGPLLAALAINVAYLADVILPASVAHLQAIVLAAAAVSYTRVLMGTATESTAMAAATQ